MQHRGTTESRRRGSGRDPSHYHDDGRQHHSHNHSRCGKDDAKQQQKEEPLLMWGSRRPNKAFMKRGLSTDAVEAAQNPVLMECRKNPTNTSSPISGAAVRMPPLRKTNARHAVSTPSPIPSGEATSSSSSSGFTHRSVFQCRMKGGSTMTREEIQQRQQALSERCCSRGNGDGNVGKKNDTEKRLDAAQHLEQVLVREQLQQSRARTPVAGQRARGNTPIDQHDLQERQQRLLLNHGRRTLLDAVSSSLDGKVMKKNSKVLRLTGVKPLSNSNVDPADEESEDQQAHAMHGDTVSGCSAILSGSMDTTATGDPAMEGETPTQTGIPLPSPTVANGDNDTQDVETFNTTTNTYGNGAPPSSGTTVVKVSTLNEEFQSLVVARSELLDALRAVVVREAAGGYFAPTSWQLAQESHASDIKQHQHEAAVVAERDAIQSSFRRRRSSSNSNSNNTNNNSPSSMPSATFIAFASSSPFRSADHSPDRDKEGDNQLRSDNFEHIQRVSFDESGVRTSSSSPPPAAKGSGAGSVVVGRRGSVVAKVLHNHSEALRRASVAAATKQTDTSTSPHNSSANLNASQHHASRRKSATYRPADLPPLIRTDVDIAIGKLNKKLEIEEEAERNRALLAEARSANPRRLSAAYYTKTSTTPLLMDDPFSSTNNISFTASNNNNNNALRSLSSVGTSNGGGQGQVLSDHQNTISNNNYLFGGSLVESQSQETPSPLPEENVGAKNEKKGNKNHHPSRLDADCLAIPTSSLAVGGTPNSSAQSPSTGAGGSPSKKASPTSKPERKMRPKGPQFKRVPIVRNKYVDRDGKWTTYEEKRREILDTSPYATFTGFISKHSTPTSAFNCLPPTDKSADRAIDVVAPKTNVIGEENATFIGGVFDEQRETNFDSLKQILTDYDMDSTASVAYRYAAHGMMSSGDAPDSNPKGSEAVPAAEEQAEKSASRRSSTARDDDATAKDEQQRPRSLGVAPPTSFFKTHSVSSGGRISAEPSAVSSAVIPDILLEEDRLSPPPPPSPSTRANSVVEPIVARRRRSSAKSIGSTGSHAAPVHLVPDMLESTIGGSDSATASPRSSVHTSWAGSPSSSSQLRRIQKGLREELEDLKPQSSSRFGFAAATRILAWSRKKGTVGGVKIGVDTPMSRSAATPLYGRSNSQSLDTIAPDTLDSSSSPKKRSSVVSLLMKKAPSGNGALVPHETVLSDNDEQEEDVRDDVHNRPKSPDPNSPDEESAQHPTSSSPPPPPLLSCLGEEVTAIVSSLRLLTTRLVQLYLEAVAPKHRGSPRDPYHSILTTRWTVDVHEVVAASPAVMTAVGFPVHGNLLLHPKYVLSGGHSTPTSTNSRSTTPTHNPHTRLPPQATKNGVSLPPALSPKGRHTSPQPSRSTTPTTTTSPKHGAHKKNRKKRRLGCPTDGEAAELLEALQLPHDFLHVEEEDDDAQRVE